jgi:murein DD-endopeptidase MepM/ murein hydrolase activator NlpD
MFDVSINTIKWANDLKNGVIHEGDVLVILPVNGLRYTVQKGDTLPSVAKKYKADQAEIAEYNSLDSGSALAVGDVIIIPGGEVAVVAPASKPKSSTTPLRGTGGPSIASYYAWPVDGGVVTQGLHGYNGIDIGAPNGTSIFAAAEGTILIARQGGYNGGYGSYVVIQHDNGTQTLYAHMSVVAAVPGAYVAQGAIIGKVGSTGKSTGNHLHFEVRGAQNPFR